MSDITSARFAQTNPLWSILGQPTNVVNPAVPARSNVEYLGLTGLADTAASLVTQVMTVVPVPVDPGTVVSKVSVLVGATAAGTPTNTWAALYAGTTTATPALIVQGTDATTTAIPASTRLDLSFAATQITAAQAPNGYIFVAIMSKATTVPSLVTVDNGAAAAQYAWFTNSPGASFAAVPGTFAFSAGSSLAASAPATLTSVAAKTVAPVVFVS